MNRFMSDVVMNGRPRPKGGPRGVRCMYSIWKLLKMSKLYGSVNGWGRGGMMLGRGMGGMMQGRAMGGMMQGRS